MSYRVEGAGKTDVGLVREKNEDSFVLEPALGLYAVCDGMGGHVGGQVASSTTVETMVESLRRGDHEDSVEPLVTAILRANRAVYARARSDAALHNMGTTVVAVRGDGDLLHLCHVGDSRIYRLRQDKLEQVTKDHSLTNLYADNPELAARYPGPHNENVIVRAVGLREEVQVDHRSVAMEHGDVYLLCSDGLTDMVDDWMLKEMLGDCAQGQGSVEECASTLIRSALSNGGVDNVTALVIRIIEN